MNTNTRRWLALLLLWHVLAFSVALSIPDPVMRAQETQAQQAQPDNGPWQACWGSKTDKCPDGKFHDSRGNIQPDTCSNAMMNMDGTPNAHMHDCKCAIAMTPADSCPPEGIARTYLGMGPDCKVNCREDACGCVNLCDSAADADSVKPAPKTKPAPKKGGKK